MRNGSLKSNRPPRVVVPLFRVVNADPAQGRAVRRFDRVAVQERRSQQQWSYHRSPSGRWSQTGIIASSISVNKDGIPAKVERLNDPNRTANIALVCYADGERRYIIANKGMVVGQQIMSGSGSADQVR